MDGYYSEPLPLIERPFYTKDSQQIYGSESEYESISDTTLRRIGYLILIMSWLVFTITINSFFGIWKYVIEPLKLNEVIYSRVYSIMEGVDGLVVSVWCIYVVVWWWSLSSWCGLKLFRHSKGIHNQ